MRQNPLSLLVLFAAIAILPGLVSAQKHTKAIEPPTERKELVAEIKRERKRAAIGPARKNPLAAGRQLAINRANHEKAVKHKRRKRSRERAQRRESSFTSIRSRSRVN